jgi:tRNA dimethylallyltransferase
MWWHEISRPLIVLVGPTAVGKTRFSIELAKKINGEIISADSRYFYREMDIGTAKPSDEEMQGIPHHLIDILDPDQQWSLAEFQHMTLQLISNIHDKGKVPILVGGSGQYIKCIVEGWEMPSQARDDKLRDVLEREVDIHGGQFLYSYLQKVDPSAASFIDARNIRRSLRAVEVILRTGYRFSDQRRVTNSPYSRKIIGLIRDRTELYKRIDERIYQMLENGFIQEVENLLKKGYSPDLPSLSAIGYRELCNYLSGKISIEEAILLMKRNTRQFVRKQSNWFREKDPNIKWFYASTEIENVHSYILSGEGWLLPH